MPTIKGNFIVEVDGFGRIRATEVDPGDGSKQKVGKLSVGDQEEDILVRGKWEGGQLKIMHAIGVPGTNALQEFAAYHTDFKTPGGRTDQINARLITLDQDGQTTLAVDEYQQCLPVQFTPESREGKSEEAARYTIVLEYTRHVPYV